MILQPRPTALSRGCGNCSWTTTSPNAFWVLITEDLGIIISRSCRPTTIAGTENLSLHSLTGYLTPIYWLLQWSCRSDHGLSSESCNVQLVQSPGFNSLLDHGYSIAPCLRRPFSSYENQLHLNPFFRYTIFE